MSKAERQQRWRERRRRGLRRLQVDVDDDAFADALIESGRLDPDQTRDPEALGKAASELLRTWAQHWIDARR